jgi:hypothetical protein
MKHKWTKENVIEESKKYSSRTDFCHLAKSAYAAALKHGWLSEMPWLESTRRQSWTKEEVIAEASKYTTLKEFVANASGAYQAAKRNDWLKDITWPSMDQGPGLEKLLSPNHINTRQERNSPR